MKPSAMQTMTRHLRKSQRRMAECMDADQLYIKTGFREKYNEALRRATLFREGIESLKEIMA